jgi:uncharacterized protein (TIGR02246 family)
MQADERAIRAVVQSWHELTAKGDVAGVLSLMAEDAVFLVSGKPAMNGRAAFEKGLRRSKACPDRILGAGERGSRIRRSRVRHDAIVRQSGSDRRFKAGT